MIRYLALTVVLWSASLTPGSLSAQQKRLIEPSDCIRVRTLNDNYFYRAIQINPQGTLVAYIVRTPNLEKNRNDNALFVRSLTGEAKLVGKAILSGGTISQLKWLATGRDVVLLTKIKGHVAVVKIDVTNGRQQVLAATDRDIEEFTTDRSGTTVVFATEEPPGSPHKPKALEDAATGFRISYQPASVPVPLSQRTLYFTKRTSVGSWTAPKQIKVQWPTTGSAMRTFSSGQNLRLSLSPDGTLLLISCLGVPFPEKWKKSPYVGTETLVTVTILTNLVTGATTIPLESIFTGSVPLWSPDSRSFIVEARSPVNSQWEREDIRNGLGVANAHHLFWVDPFTGEVQLIASHVANGIEQPLLWKENNELLVHTSQGTISRFLYKDGAWSASSSFSIPLPHFYRFATLASDGQYVVGDYQTFTTPPELFVYKIGEPNTKILEKLNPQFDHLSVARVEEIHWTTSTGYEVEGALLLPPDYSPSRKYPLVIQANFNSGWFACDAGESREPSQIPQPVANAGMLYLMRSYPENWNSKDEMNHWPKGYPGNIGEAAFEMDVWDSAIEKLVDRGIVDKDKIGIIGFSRKGWTTEFMLAQSKVHFRAATISDNVQYSLGEYDLFHDLRTMNGYDAMYGGPPYGPSLNTWLRYSISFNLNRITTPLLMESMGYGQVYGNVTAPPLQLSSRFEVFVGLNRLNKPAELYYYPYESHQPEHPQARLASMQRNLDWYRFWLQGYERPALECREQYARWRRFRDEQTGDETKLR